MDNYTQPRVTFVGSDPKIATLKKAIDRVSRVAGPTPIAWAEWRLVDRFTNLWHAKNRRVAVLLRKVQRANAA